MEAPLQGPRGTSVPHLVMLLLLLIPLIFPFAAYNFCLYVCLSDWANRLSLGVALWCMGHKRLNDDSEVAVQVCMRVLVQPSLLGFCTASPLDPEPPAMLCTHNSM